MEIQDKVKPMPTPIPKQEKSEYKASYLIKFEFTINPEIYALEAYEYNIILSKPVLP